jgi:hypothetical protein
VAGADWRDLTPMAVLALSGFIFMLRRRRG